MSEHFYMIVPAALAGLMLSVPCACVPGLHIYNILGLLALGAYHLSGACSGIPSELTIPFVSGMLTGYAVLNTIPAVLLAAPDESSMFTVQPGQKMLMRGRGLDGVITTAFGSAGALLLIPLVLAPLALTVLPTIYKIVRPHTHWVLWCVIAFMLMSEWPHPLPNGQAGLRRFLAAWKSLAIGLLTFLLAGLLGFIIFFAPIGYTATAFQNLLPAFVGLFTMPWLLMNLVSGVEPPPQKSDAATVTLCPGSVVYGSLAGALGGGFAAFFPVITGGVGGFLAGHTVAMRDSRSFLISQGASKLVYYVGGFLLFFVPGLGVRRGGGAWMVSGLVTPYTRYEFFTALSAVALSGALALLLVEPLTKVVLRLIAHAGLRKVSLVALVVMVGLVYAMTGLAGLLVMLTATGIGLLPIIYGARRMNCLAVILLPMACNMSGFGARIVHGMGLL